MKVFFTLLCLFSFSVHAQDPKAYIAAFDSKLYSLKSKGVKDFVVDVESSKLTKQMNDQMIFGKVKSLVFRIFWTSSPERLAVDVIGLPEGFREIKEELKLNIVSGLDNLLPMGIQEKFQGYKMMKGPSPKEFIAQDQSGVAPIPAYILKFDAKDTLAEVIGKKPVGTFRVTTKYDKQGFSEGKWVLTEQVTSSSENGLSIVSTKDIEYDEVNGIGVVEQVKIIIDQNSENSDSKPIKVEETLQFKNYKLNTGEGIKYFLGDTLKK
ncbi:MAG TPA: hypothetical protein VNJ08_03475 [Bacteriovoracaceae bacterium]|nr:hypothetical protein [Bacteriovoracaceae bacterium]